MLESLTIRAITACVDLPPAAQEQLGILPGQVNVLVRLVLRPVERTMTDAQANALRDRVYAALHSGPHLEWATASRRQAAAAGPRTSGRAAAARTRRIHPADHRGHARWRWT